MPKSITKRPKPVTSFRLSVDGRRLLARLAAEHAVSRGAILEIAIRDLARKQGVSA